MKLDTNNSYARTIGINWDCPRPAKTVILSVSVKASPATVVSDLKKIKVIMSGINSKSLINFEKVYPTVTIQGQENSFPFSIAWSCQYLTVFIASERDLHPNRLNELENIGVTWGSGEA